MNQLSSSSKHSMLTRVLTSIALLAVLVPCLVFGDWAFFALSIPLSFLAIHELLQAPGQRKYPWYVRLVVFLFLLFFVYGTFLLNYLGEGSPFDGTTGFYLQKLFFPILFVVLYFVSLATISVLSTKVTLSDMTYLFAIGLFLALGLQGMLYVRYFPNSTGLLESAGSIVPVEGTGVWTYGNYFSQYYSSHQLNPTYASCLLFFFLLLGTWCSDVGAYFVGVLFGRHPMSPRVSPHKTWEGFFGGMAFSMAVSLAFAALFEYAFQMPLVPGLLQFAPSPLLSSMGVLGGQSWVFLVLLSLLMPIVGNIGGFLFSLVKRHYGIKDYGWLFPGHGGIIDRFDSILTNALMFSLVLALLSGGSPL